MKDAASIAHPFLLTIVVHSAHKLAIADFTSSDPYVILLLDKKEIGRTPTIYRNLNPVWGVKFVVPLTHVHSVLTFRLYDEDSGKNDDILGVTSVDLSTLYKNEVLEKNYPLRQREDSEELAKGTLSFSLHVGKSETLIRIMQNETPSLEVSYGMSSMLREEIDNCLGQHVGDYSLGLDSAPIYMTMMKSPFLRADQDPVLQVINKGLLRDLMCDVRSLLRCQTAILSARATQNTSIPRSPEKNKQFISVAEDLLPMTLLRSFRALQSSTRFQVENSEYTTHSPSAEAVIVLEFKDKSSCTLVFPDRKNHYLIWVWMKWLKLVISIQKGELKKTRQGGEGSAEAVELPAWAVTGKLISALSIVLRSSTGLEVNGRTL